MTLHNKLNTVFCLSMVSELEALHKRNSADKQRLEQVFPLMLALTDARQKLPIDDSIAGYRGHSWLGFSVINVDWAISTPLMFSPELDTRLWKMHFLGNKLHNRLLSGCRCLHGLRTRWDLRKMGWALAGLNWLHLGCFSTNNIYLWNGLLVMVNMLSLHRSGLRQQRILGWHCLSWVVHFRLTYRTYKHWCLRTLLLSLNVAKWHHFTFLGISSSQLALISDRSCHDNGARLVFFATSHVLLQ